MISAGKALSAFWYALFSITGALLAHLWQTHQWVALAAIIVGSSLVGYLVGDRLPQLWLFPSEPVAGALSLELWILFPGMVAACAAAAVIIISSSFTQIAPDEKTNALGKAVLDKSSDAVTALLSALFLKIFEDADDDVTGDRVSSVFADHYKVTGPGTAANPRVFRYQGGAPVINWVYGNANPGGIAGWGFSARRQRAQKVAENLLTERV